MTTRARGLAQDLASEWVVDPFRRLKWGFIPTRRIVDETDLMGNIESAEVEAEAETEAEADVEGDSEILEGKSSNVKVDQHSSEKESVTDSNLEYRDEANRKWWAFFNEQEYRVNEKQAGRAKWWQWFGSGVSKQEKKLLLKLDILLAFYSCMAYWVKYLDSSNLNNAYVSGMREELNFKGNQLVETQVMYTVGNIVFQLPMIFLLDKIPLNFFLPTLDICWSILTLGCSKVNSVPHLKAIRFFIGVFEAPSYLAYQYLFGSFYKHDEMVRRSAFYYLGQYAGIMSAGGIQSAVYAALNGRGGLSGWRWNFIVDGIISVVVGIIGYYSLPGDPYNCYSIFLTDDEIRLARKRLDENNTEKSDFSTKIFDKKVWIRIFSDWKIYVLTLWNIFCWNNNNGSSGAYLLWLKSLKKYSIPEINKLSMITPALGMIYLLVTGIFADKLHSRWGAIVLTQVFNFTGNVILAAWNVPQGAKWFAYALQYFGWAMAPVLYSWQNDICRRDAQARSIILVIMNMLAQTTTAFMSVLVWKTTEAPRFLKGYTWTAVSAVCLSIWTILVLWLYKREERQNARANGIVLYNSKDGAAPPLDKQEA
ncbi:LAME_0B05600g1_1 [Lachancea meyersii CBS 8951]|uniref:LAME_0B05600g1_1 n=1 Tax=Lachancea meyersii CBS 8951 TaxID=1266667 RepID=A0A1G4IVW4_9SACH|nr:LAME_0B05600g1_1 [Lachancea meyersii CBS 8951]